jgi:hypothetical protein
VGLLKRPEPTFGSEEIAVVGELLLGELHLRGRISLRGSLGVAV